MQIEVKRVFISSDGCRHATFEKAAEADFFNEMSDRLAKHLDENGRSRQKYGTMDREKLYHAFLILAP